MFVQVCLELNVALSFANRWNTHNINPFDADPGVGCYIPQSDVA